MPRAPSPSAEFGEIGSFQNCLQVLRGGPDAQQPAALGWLYLAVCAERSVDHGTLMVQLDADEEAGVPPWPVPVAAAVVSREHLPAAPPAPPPCPARISERLRCGADAPEWHIDCAVLVLADCLRGDTRLSRRAGAAVAQGLGRECDPEAVFRAAAGRRAVGAREACWRVAQRLYRARTAPPRQCVPLGGGPEVGAALRTSLALAAPQCITGENIAALCSSTDSDIPLRVAANWAAAQLHPLGRYSDQSDSEDCPGEERAEGEGDPLLVAAIAPVLIAAACTALGGSCAASQCCALGLIALLCSEDCVFAAVADGAAEQCAEALSRTARGTGDAAMRSWEVLQFLCDMDEGAEAVVLGSASFFPAVAEAVQRPEVEQCYVRALSVATRVGASYPRLTGVLVGDADVVGALKKAGATAGSSDDLGSNARAVLYAALGTLARHCAALEGAVGAEVALAFVDALAGELSRLLCGGRPHPKLPPAGLPACVAALAGALSPDNAGRGALIERVRAHHHEAVSALAAACCEWKPACRAQLGAAALFADSPELLDAEAAAALTRALFALGNGMLMPPRDGGCDARPLFCELCSAVLPVAPADVACAAAVDVVPLLLDATALMLRRPPGSALDPVLPAISAFGTFLDCGGAAEATFAWRCCGLSSGLELPALLLHAGRQWAPLSGISPERKRAITEASVPLVTRIVSLLPSTVDAVERSGLIAHVAKCVARTPSWQAPGLAFLHTVCLAMPGVVVPFSHDPDLLRVIAQSTQGADARTVRHARLLAALMQPHAAPADQEVLTAAGAASATELGAVLAAVATLREAEVGLDAAFDEAHRPKFDASRAERAEEAKREAELHRRRMDPARARREAQMLEARRWVALRDTMEQSQGLSGFRQAAAYWLQAAAVLFAIARVLGAVFHS